MKKHNYLKILPFLVVISTLLVGCGGNSSPPEETSMVQEDSTLIENDNETEETEEEEDLSYQGDVYNCKFLKKDKIFQLTLDSYDSRNYVYVDLNAVPQDSPALNSDYLTTENITDDDSRVTGLHIYDLENNNVDSRFINDFEHEEIMSLRTIEDEQSIIVVKEIQETPTDSYCAIKFYNENGDKLCQTDSNVQNDYLHKGMTPFQSFERLTYVDWVGDSVLQFSDPNKSEIFSINVETGEILPPNTLFSNGYGIANNDGKKIIDLHGNLVSDLSDFERFEMTFPFSENLFFNPREKCFYNKDLQKIIDLNQYDSFSFTRDELSDRASKSIVQPFVFQDGYCQIDVYNSEGTRFYGVIDSEGNEVYPFSIEDNSYKGVLCDGMLLMKENQVYDISTNTMLQGPDDMKYQIFYNGKVYYVNSYHEFCMYDYETKKGTLF